MSESPLSYSFSNLSKVYRLYAAPRDRLFEAITGRPRHAEVHALRSASGSIERGAVLGVIGENGSGKSTLFKILAGTTTATSGSVNIPGRIASILELGSAFHPDDTGRRNVILQAALAGLSREEVADALPEIEAFAELGDFFDRPVKTYSSGMQMRLAFSVATAVLPDVPTMDEAGLKGFDASTWHGLVVPTGTPPEIVAKLHDAAVKALQDPGVQVSLGRLGVDIVGDTPEQFKAYIAAEIPKWTAIVKASGATMDK